MRFDTPNIARLGSKGRKWVAAWCLLLSVFLASRASLSTTQHPDTAIASTAWASPFSPSASLAFAPSTPLALLAPLTSLTSLTSLAPLANPTFQPNTRANTDATSYAQQEPSIAVNPTNPLNIIVDAKDERSAPGPGTDTKEVWLYASTDGGS